MPTKNTPTKRAATPRKPRAPRRPTVSRHTGLVHAELLAPKTAHFRTPPQAHGRYWWWLAHLSAVALGVLVIGSSAVILSLQAQYGTTRTEAPSTPTPPVTTAPLTGLAVSPELAARRPWAVMISNLAASRPQVGLGQADVVFEAPAEAGITRLMAVYQSELPERVGPVRSARAYFNDWAANFSALYSHSGGSTEALEQLKKPYGNLQDVNEFFNGAAYERDASKKAPHNLFTGAQKFWDYITAHQWLNFKGFIPFVFGATPAQGVEATNFTIPYDPKEYAVRYDWNQTSQSYERSVGGKPHLDGATGNVLTAKNVVIMVADIVPVPNDPLLKVTVTTLGSGRAILLRNGQHFEGRWSKPTLGDPLLFTDAAGNPLAFAPGNSWISVIDHATEKALSQQPKLTLEPSH